MATTPHQDFEDDAELMPGEQPVEPEMDVGMPAVPEEEDEARRVPK